MAARFMDVEKFPRTRECIIREVRKPLWKGHGDLL